MLARYEEFVRALIPMNVRDLAPDSRVRPQLAEAIRHSFPPAILVYVWRDRMPFDDVVSKCRDRIVKSLPEAKYAA